LAGKIPPKSGCVVVVVGCRFLWRARLEPLLPPLLLLPARTVTGAMTSASVSRPLRKLLAAGPAIYRDGNTLLTGDACPPQLLPELEALCLPRISEEDGRALFALLKEHAGRVR
jgi:hypothetical protein